MSDIVISAENLSKSYMIGHKVAQVEHYTALRDVIARNVHDLARKTRDMIQGRPIVQGDDVEEFWALKDISFEIKQGDRVGIIGRNGAGKSTLLKILSRITEPTKGRVHINGRVASLLEVGTGFHPELSGRENIFLNGAILGMSRREIQRKFDEIVAFAEIEKFLDTPVKRYSSGMYVRLAFAVAAHLEPEILIVDEVLAVGDAQFQKKCLGKMEDVGKEGRTVLFVSHNMLAIKAFCSKAMVLDQGKIVADGEVSDATAFYLQATNINASQIKWLDDDHGPGNENIRLKSILVEPKEGEVLNIDSGVRIEIQFHNKVRDINLDTTMHLWTLEGICLFESGVLISRNNDSKVGFYKVSVEIPSHLLNAGGYRVTLIFGRDQRHLLFMAEDVISFEIADTSTGRGSNMQKAPGVIRPLLDWAVSGEELIMEAPMCIGPC